MVTLIGIKGSLDKNENVAANSIMKAYKAQKTVNPGPGTYENCLAINQNGRYVSSYIPSVQTPSFKITREHTKINYNPGPGYYPGPSDFGIYCSSKFLKEAQKKE